MRSARRPRSISEDRNSNSEVKSCQQLSSTYSTKQWKQRTFIRVNFTIFQIKCNLTLSKDENRYRPLSFDAEVSKIENSSFTLTPSLISSQEEADTKVVLHEKLLEHASLNITIRSPSEDNYLVILVILLLWEFKELVILDNGHRKTGKSLGYLIKEI